MRTELNQMEIIEKYITGKLSEADKIAFEKKLATDPALQKEVQLQKELMQGIQRTAIKQSVKTGLKKYRFTKKVKNFGLTGLAIIAVTVASFFIYHFAIKSKANENSAQELPELNEQGQTLWSDADKYLPSQQFDVDPEKDTVIETQDGIVFAVPAHSFLDADGKPATGKIQMEVKEALNAADIMKAGLTTKSGDKLLETGGMFYVNARQNDKSLKIDPNNALYAEVPTKEVKPNMQLFEGKRLPDGNIDWINPKPIQKDLIPVDIFSLNFYPPHYLDSLKKWGYNTKDKKFTDSLYYSFAAEFHEESAARSAGRYEPALTDTTARPASVFYVFKNEKTGKEETFSSQQIGAMDHSFNQYEFIRSYYTGSENPVANSGAKIFMQNCAVCHSTGTNKITGPGLQGVMTRVPNEDWLHKWIKNNKAVIVSGDAYANKVFNENAKADMTVFAASLSDDDITAVINYIKTGTASEGINPAKIKTIWSKEFQNSLISTREFEARLPSVFSTCNNNVLDLYINNLDKNLSAIDSLAYSLSNNSQFLNFAARGDGKVKHGSINVRLLKKYYEEKTKIFTEAIAKTKSTFWEKQSEADVQAQLKKQDHSEKDVRRLNENFQKELNVNLDEAYRQLGKHRPGSGSAATDVATTTGTPIPDQTYGVPVTSTGWCNIDSYTFAATSHRTTIDYTDRDTGKKALIKYEPLNITINNSQNYDRVLVYLLPDKLSSFMRVNTNASGDYTEKLDELMTYKLVTIAYKGEESFYYSQDNVKPGKLALTLIKSTNLEIQNNVNKLSDRSQSTALNEELNYISFEKGEAKRQQEIVKIKELTNKVRPVVLPCIMINTETDYNTETGDVKYFDE